MVSAPMQKPLYIPLALAVAASVLAVDLACSAHHGTTYNQASMPLPPVEAPAFSPVEDAPHIFEPGRPSPVQPGPRPTRVLPETPESRKGPGLWSATPPVATTGNDSTTEIFDWNVPLPENDAPASERIKRCADIMRAASPKVLSQSDIQHHDKINIQWRRCWPHAATQLCLSRLLDDTKSVLEAALLTRAIEFGEVAASRACSGAMWSPGMTNKLADTWRAR